MLETDGLNKSWSHLTHRFVRENYPASGNVKLFPIQWRLVGICISKFIS